MKTNGKGLFILATLLVILLGFGIAETAVNASGNSLKTKSCGSTFLQDVGQGNESLKD